MSEQDRPRFKIEEVARDYFCEEQQVHLAGLSSPRARCNSSSGTGKFSSMFRFRVLKEVHMPNSISAVSWALRK